jgi:hypothetical protein
MKPLRETGAAFVLEHAMSVMTLLILVLLGKV